MKAEQMYSKAIIIHYKGLVLISFQALLHHSHCQLVMRYVMDLTLLRIASDTLSGWRTLTERELCAKHYFYRRTTCSMLKTLKAWR